MLGEMIAGRALADAGRRDLPAEQIGPRPAGVDADRTVGAVRGQQGATARRP